MIPFIQFDPKHKVSRDLTVIIMKKILDYDSFRSYQLKFSLGRKLSKKEPIEKDVIICSIRCIYWEECGYKNGGYPCKLQHLMQVDGFHGE